MKTRIFALIFLPCLLLTLVCAQQQEGPPRFGTMGMGNGVRGTVTAISGNELTVKNEQGETYQVETGPNTRIMKDRQPAKVSDVHVGDVIVAGGQMDDQSHKLGAAFLAVLNAEAVQRMKQMEADFGKTWTAGKITSINTDNLTISIERPDKKTQTITVNENTSFQKHRESITLADIKVGDMVSARGELQNGNFVASVLNVVEPRMRDQGGPAPGSGAPLQLPH
ncbi:MAG: DUF5666 domain-containing protein [Bacillota bacterium]|nr:DUF5666 domain-containing protein [Bacillota bacterium]